MSHESPLQENRRARIGVALLCVAHSAAAIVLSQFAASYHDEGALSYACSAAMSEAPAATLFFAKCRPLLALLGYPIAPLGMQAFVCLMAVLSGLGTWLLYQVALVTRVGTPWLAAFVFACSPVLLFGAAAGVANVPGTVLVVVFLWLWHVAKRPLGAAMLLGALPLARFELALVVVAYLPLMMPDLGWRSVAIFVAPLLWLGGGAAYHGDALWLWHHPPTLLGGLPESLAHHETIGPSIVSLFALTPALPMIAIVGRRSLQTPWWVAGGLLLSGLALLPMTGLVHVDSAPRYLLVALPFVALVLGDVLAGLRQRLPDDALTWLGLLLMAVLIGTAHDQPGFLLAASAWGACLATILLHAVQRAAAVALLSICLSAAPFAAAEPTMLWSSGADELLRWAEGELGTAVIFTDESRLVRASRRRRCRIEARYLIGDDQVHELQALTTESQRAALSQTLLHAFAGEQAAWPSEGVLLVRDDERTERGIERRYRTVQTIARRDEHRLVRVAEH